MWGAITTAGPLLGRRWAPSTRRGYSRRSRQANFQVRIWNQRTGPPYRRFAMIRLMRPEHTVLPRARTARGRRLPGRGGGCRPRGGPRGDGLREDAFPRLASDDHVVAGK